MSKKIIIAGGGHGGIAVGMLLAQNGFQVEVYEKTLRIKWAMTGQIFLILVLLKQSVFLCHLRICTFIKQI